MNQNRILNLITASKCNLNCSYCFLHKNQSYINEDEKILEAIKNNTFLANVMKTLQELNINKHEFLSCEFWGGEPSLHFCEMENMFKDIFYYFPNIKFFTFSTNFLTPLNNYLTFINAVNKYAHHPIEISMQISVDGPDFINEQTRHYKFEVLRKNIYNFIDAVNDLELNNIKYNFYFKATLPHKFYFQLSQDEEMLNNYLDFFVKERDLIVSKIKNPNIIFGSLGAIFNPSIEHSYNFTKEDGINVAIGARKLHAKLNQLQYEDCPLIGINAVDRWIDLDGDDIYRYNLKCGQLDTSLLFNWDGSLNGCTNGFLDHDLNNLQWLKENDLHEYNEVQNTLWVHDQYNADGSLNYDKIRKLHNYMQTFWKFHNDFCMTVMASQLYDLALAGQVSPIYLTSPQTRLRHVSMVGRMLLCYFLNCRNTGSSYAPCSDVFKLYCNGLLEFYEEIRGIGNEFTARTR